MNLSNYLKRKRALNTLKGNLYQLCITPQLSASTSSKSYVHTFKVNNVPVEFRTQKPINAQDGDFVVVAGIYAPNKFKAYSLKKINLCLPPNCDSISGFR